MDEMTQRSPEWFAARAGVITASRVADLMSKTKTGVSAKRSNMIACLAVERLTGQCVETYSNDAMRRGTELEPEAIAAFSFETDSPVEEIAFIKHHATLPRVGCSPDGLIGDDGMVEIKCPNAMNKHLGALKSGAHTKEYRWQLQHQLFVTGRKWVDAVSYDPRFPLGLQLAIRRVFPNAEDQIALAEEIAKSDAEIERIVADLRSLGNLEAAE